MTYSITSINHIYSLSRLQIRHPRGLKIVRKQLTYLAPIVAQLNLSIMNNLML